MQSVARNDMTEQRALLTETEREILSGQKEVKDNYRYSVESRVRTRIRKRFVKDADLLEEHQPKMYQIMVDALCKDATAAESTERFDEESQEPHREDSGSVHEEDVRDHTRDVEEVLRGLDLSGSGSRYESRVEAVLNFYELLRDRPGERVSKGEFKQLVEDEAIDVGFASFDSLWNNWVKSNSSQGRDTNTLEQLPGVEMDGDDYVYRGEDDE